MVAGVGPFIRVADHAGANHIQIDVDDTFEEVFLRLDRHGMIAIFPERPVPLLAAVIVLCGPAGHQPHGSRQRIVVVCRDDQVDMVAGDYVVQHA